MKNSVIVLMSIILLVSCNNKKNLAFDCTLSSADSLEVIIKASEITDRFAEANNSFNYDKISTCWAYENPDFIAIENTETIHEEQGLYERLKKFYTNPELDSTHLTWSKKEIIPLSKTTAHLYGEYQVVFKYKSYKNERLYDDGRYYVYISALCGEVDGLWKFRRFHESFKILDAEN